jgi:hypothetical protein
MKRAELDMKRLSTWVLALTMTIAAVPAMPADTAKLPPYTVGRSEVRTLPVDKAGRHYALYIHLPASYATEPSKRYPVVFVTDGSTTRSPPSSSPSPWRTRERT